MVLNMSNYERSVEKYARIIDIKMPEPTGTTPFYTHVLKRGGMAVKSPLGDALRYSKI